VSIYGPLEQVGIDWVIQSALLAVGLLLLAGWSVRRSLAAADGGVLPDRGITVRNCIEAILDGLSELAEQTIGHDYQRFLPLVFSIFFFILISNLLGLVPAVGGATSDISVGLAWGTIVFFVYHYVGIAKQGWKYVYQFTGPLFDLKIGGKHYHVPLLAPLMVVIELPLNIARVFTLAIRLLANMFADHTVVAVWLGLMPVAVPAIFLGLGLVISFIQAFVFALLSMIYIGLALEEHH
jgi:F-type H+-transporting ATPase subunit a